MHGVKVKERPANQIIAETTQDSYFWQIQSEVKSVKMQYQASKPSFLLAGKARSNECEIETLQATLAKMLGEQT